MTSHIQPDPTRIVSKRLSDSPYISEGVEADIKFEQRPEQQPEQRPEQGTLEQPATEGEPLKIESVKADGQLVKEISKDAPHSPKQYKEMTFSNTDFRKIDLTWEHLNIEATINKKVIQNGKRKAVRETKTILNNISGAVKNGRFTAIMGPSGSGKTTLLNFLSARISGKGLKINGAIKVNGRLIDSLESIAASVAYVMQDDILLATITPREAFMFIANLRLKLSHLEKKKKVQDMLDDLGLAHVASTRVGNNLIRGLSGGERKRTSIGVELMTNPSMIFLDEPTTGLDSKTAENVITLLFNLAKKGGRTVVSTIHQPSSQIFQLFDELTLLVRGNIIYQGKSQSAVNYFTSIGFMCPKLTNPADYFMKIMNESGILLEAMERDKSNNSSQAALMMSQEEIENKFVQRLELYNKAYSESGMTEQALSNLESGVVDTQNFSQVSWPKQFWYIFVRKCQDEVRNPMEIRVKLAQKLIFSAIVMLAFNQLGTGEAGIQNRNGVLFFYAVMCYMAGVQGSIGTFSAERPIFVRERLNKSYATSAYFWAKAAAELPLLVAQPFLLISTSYYVIGLNNPAYKYFILIAIGICCTIAGSGYGLVISTVVPSMELATALIPILIIPMMLFAGYFVGQNKIPYFFYEFEFISPVKYGFQAAVVNEFNNFPEFDQYNPLSNLGTYQGIGLSIGILLIISFVTRFISYFGLVMISTPKKATVLPPKDKYEVTSKSPEQANNK